MTEDDALKTMLEKEGLDEGAKIQFSVPDVPYSAITFGLNDDPEVAMWWADQWRLAYLKRFDEGVATNEEAPAPVIEQAPVLHEASENGLPEVTHGVGFKVDGRWPSGDLKVACTTCKNPKQPQYPASMYLNEPGGKFQFVLDNLGLTQSAYTCTLELEGGGRCQNYVTKEYAEQLAA